MPERRPSPWRDARHRTQGRVRASAVRSRARLRGVTVRLGERARRAERRSWGKARPQARPRDCEVTTVEDPGHASRACPCGRRGARPGQCRQGRFGARGGDGCSAGHGSASVEGVPAIVGRRRCSVVSRCRCWPTATNPGAASQRRSRRITTPPTASGLMSVASRITAFRTGPRAARQAGRPTARSRARTWRAFVGSPPGDRCASQRASDPSAGERSRWRERPRRRTDRIGDSDDPRARARGGQGRGGEIADRAGGPAWAGLRGSAPPRQRTRCRIPPTAPPGGRRIDPSGPRCFLDDVSRETKARHELGPGDTTARIRPDQRRIRASAAAGRCSGPLQGSRLRAGRCAGRLTSSAPTGIHRSRTEASSG